MNQRKVLGNNIGNGEAYTTRDPIRSGWIYDKTSNSWTDIRTGISGWKEVSDYVSQSTADKIRDLYIREAIANGKTIMQVNFKAPVKIK